MTNDMPQNFCSDESLYYLNLGKGSFWHSIPYRHVPGDGTGPGVLWFHGFRASMESGKAKRVANWCAENGIAFTAFDAPGHGLSASSLLDFSLPAYRDDALALLNMILCQPQVLVGSSIGAWAAVCAAQARPDLVAGLVTISAAPDYTEKLKPSFENGEDVVSVKLPFSEPFKVSRKMLEESASLIVLDKMLNPPDYSVRLLHGDRDVIVPFRQSMKLAQKLAGPDTVFRPVSGAGHGMKRPQDMELVIKTISDVLKKTKKRTPAP